MKAMILAAGRGERMRPLTDRTPKPLLEVCGRRLIEYHLDAIARAGIREVVINLSWLGDQIRTALGDGSRYGLTIHYSEEGPVALETGGGIFAALPLLGAEPFLVVSGDIWTEYPLGDCAAKLAAADVAHFVLVPNPDFHSTGDFAIDNGRLVGYGERHTYANIGVFRPEFFAGCSAGRYPLGPLMHDWIGRGRVSGELYPGPWHNLGTPGQLADLISVRQRTVRSS
jgi:N-acetyl-alpha-D-muramate 1-phosphate uridylyltransferase